MALVDKVIVGEGLTFALRDGSTCGLQTMCCHPKQSYSVLFRQSFLLNTSTARRETPIPPPKEAEENHGGIIRIDRAATVLCDGIADIVAAIFVYGRNRNVINLWICSRFQSASERGSSVDCAEGKARPSQVHLY